MFEKVKQIGLWARSIQGWHIMLAFALSSLLAPAYAALNGLPDPIVLTVWVVVFAALLGAAVSVLWLRERIITHQFRRKPDYKKWDAIQWLPEWQAACLWDDVEPYSPVKDGTPSYATLQMIKSAAIDGHLGQPKTYPGEGWQRYSRDKFRDFARSKGVKPPAFFPEEFGRAVPISQTPMAPPTKMGTEGTLLALKVAESVQGFHFAASRADLQKELSFNDRLGQADSIDVVLVTGHVLVDDFPNARRIKRLILPNPNSASFLEWIKYMSDPNGADQIRETTRRLKGTGTEVRWYPEMVPVSMILGDTDKSAGWVQIEPVLPFLPKSERANYTFNKQQFEGEVNRYAGVFSRMWNASEEWPIPFQEAAQIAYERAEKDGWLNRIVGKSSNPENRIDSLKYMMLTQAGHGAVTLRGAELPSRQILPIPASEIAALYPPTGENILRRRNPDQIAYTGVEISRQDMEKVINIYCYLAMHGPSGAGGERP